MLHHDLLPLAAQAAGAIGSLPGEILATRPTKMESRRQRDMTDVVRTASGLKSSAQCERNHGDNKQPTALQPEVPMSEYGMRI